ncbi:MAG: C25 family cysteine peptidase [Candidatus Edwardsbacteria bacterium]
MGKLPTKVIGTAFCVLGFLTYGHCQGTWVSFDGKSLAGTPATASVISSDQSKTVIVFNIPGMWVNTKAVGTNTYHVLTIPGCEGSTIEIGKPQIPAFRKLIAIPPQANATVAVTNLAEISFSGYKVWPFQTPETDSGPVPPFTINSAFYGTNVFYPEINAEISLPAIWRDMRVVNLGVYPCRFNPSTGVIKAYSQITVEISYSGTSNINILPGYPSAVSQQYSRMYRSLILNYKKIGIAISMTYTMPKYLIIVADNYYTTIQDLLFWKKKKGIDISVVKQSAIVGTYGSDDTVQIRDYIKNQYQTGGLDYVLLVGDAPDGNAQIGSTSRIPTFLFPPPTGYSGYSYGDHYYACVAGADDYPDIAIGRLSVANIADVTNMINKIFAYERIPASDWQVTSGL